MADLAVTPANVVIYAGAKKQVGVAGETIVAGKPLYLHTDGRLKLADASTAAKAASVGVSLNGGAAGQPITYVRQGGLNPGGTVLVGTVYGVTDTPGGIGPISERAAPDFVTVLGVGVTASRIALAIQASGVAIPA
jgi:hypothetical protein